MVGLLDYRLGGRTGIELLEMAEKSGCTVPIVMFTGQDDLQIDRQAISTGAFDFLVKGQVSPRTLDRSIRHAIEQGRARRDRARAHRFVQSVLDALPMHIAILNESGIVMDVNSAWDELCRQSGGRFPACETGTNYLDFCTQSAAECGIEATNVEKAIQKVLQCDRARVSLEYASSSNGGMWFMLHAVCLRDDEKLWIVMSHEDITGRKRLEWKGAELQKISERDPLTGLYNRRLFADILRDEISRSLRYNHPLSLVMLDVDKFKQVNDTHGHQAGDDIICGVAATLAGSVRDSDWLIRYGGDEIAWLLPETDAENAYAMAERMRALINANPYSFTGPGAEVGSLSITATLGVATCPADGQDSQSLLASADSALYEAKKAGRNCVVSRRNALP